MKKTTLILGLILGLLPLNNVWSQIIGGYQTVYSEMTTTGTEPGLRCQKTIGVYPDMAVSYHEADSLTYKIGVLTVNSGATMGNSYKICDQIYIRDMEEYRLGQTVYFSGTKHIPSGNSIDSVGIIGCFHVNTDGTISNFIYYKISEVKSVLKLVTYPLNGSPRVAAIGKKPNGTSPLYYYIYMDDVIFPSYTISPHHSSGYKHTPTTLVCTDNYVCAVSYNGLNEIILRRFPKSNFWDASSNILYKYVVSEPITHTIKATFLGCRYQENGENDLGIIYMSQDTPTTWYAYFKKFDLSTMTMTMAQKNQNFAQKNDIAGLTYLAKSGLVAVLEIYDPTSPVNMSNSAVLMLDPAKTTSYTTEILYKKEQWFYSIDRLYSGDHTVNHFLVGNTTIPKSRWWAQTPVTTPNNCMDVMTTDIDIDPLSDYVYDLNPLNPVQKTTGDYIGNLLKYPGLITNCLK